MPAFRFRSNFLLLYPGFDGKYEKKKIQMQILNSLITAIQLSVLKLGLDAAFNLVTNVLKQVNIPYIV